MNDFQVNTSLEKDLQKNLQRITIDDIRWETRRGNRAICFYEYFLDYNEANSSDLFFNTYEATLTNFSTKLTNFVENTFTFGFFVTVFKIPNTFAESKGVKFRFNLEWNFNSRNSIDFADYIIRHPDPMFQDTYQYWSFLYMVWDEVTHYSKIMEELKIDDS